MDTLQSVDRELGDWIRRVVGDVRIEPSLPTGDVATATVHAYLLGIEGPTGPNDARRDVRRLVLRYLLLSSDTELAAAYDRLANLLLAALDHADYEAKGVRADAPLWSTLQLLPQPALELGVPWHVHRKVDLAPPVRHELRLGFVALRRLEGVVVGPDDVGIANARVRVPAARRATTTDHGGRFRLDGVMAGDEPLRLEVAARGRVTRVEARPGADGTPLRIRIDPVVE